MANNNKTNLEHLQEMVVSAAEKGESPTLQELLTKNKVNINRTLVTAAVKSGDFPTLRVLHDAGMNIDYDLGYMGTPLLYATQRGYSEDYIQKLFDLGADPNASMMSDTWPGLAIAATCASTHVLRLYLKHGARVQGSRALWEAAGRGLKEAVKILVLEGGADVNEVPDPDQLSPVVRERGMGTPLHEAAREGHAEILAFLRQHGGDDRIQDSSGRTPSEVRRET